MKGPLGAIVRALGGELYDGGRRALVRGPGHGPSDRSASLLLAGGRLVVHSFAGDDWRAILEDLRRRGLVDADGRLTGRSASPASARPVGPERVAAARTLWATGRPIAGTLAEKHVRGRAVSRLLPESLRFHWGVPSAVYQDQGRRRPALLTAIRDPAGALVGVEVTYLAPDGGLATLPVPRKTIGLRPAGSAVRLDPAGETLLVGEGVFTCLSASEALGAPAWALLAAANLRAWRPPPGVRRVLIAGDRGRVGEGAAAALAARLRGTGLAVSLRLPPEPHQDWNELAQARARSRAEAGRVGSGRG